MNIKLLVLKVLCVSLSLFSLLMLTPAFRSACPPSHLQDIVLFLNAIMFAVLFYGVQRRARFAWRFGWFAGGILFFEWFALLFRSALRVPKSWIPASIMVVGGIAIALYCGNWWKRQKSYFIPD